MKLDLKPELPVAAISTSEPPFERKMCDVRVEDLHEMSFRKSISDLSALDEISPSLGPPSSEAATQAPETITPPKLEPPSKEYVERIAACCSTVARPPSTVWRCKCHSPCACLAGLRARPAQATPLSVGEPSTHSRAARGLTVLTGPWQHAWLS